MSLECEFCSENQSVERESSSENQEMSSEVNNTKKLFDDAFAEKLEKSLKPRKYEFVWYYLVIMSALHLFGLYGMYLFISGGCKWQSLVYLIVRYNCSAIGVTAGVHRLWSHHSYKANLQLRVMLMLFQTQAFQEPIIKWVKEHRVHHKNTDTDADPYNALRGFWFSHFGWTVTKRTPEFREALKKLDFSDLYNDQVVIFQKKHFLKLAAVLTFIGPTLLPFLLWNESLWNAFFFCACTHWVFIMNSTLTINSFAHLLGHKPYDTGMTPRENAMVSLLISGEGWHNFHHSFPSDYGAAELGHYSLNFAKLFIDVMAAIGWAYDLKTVAPETVKKRMLRSGDGTQASIWGEVVGNDVYQSKL